MVCLRVSGCHWEIFRCDWLIASIRNICLFGCVSVCCCCYVSVGSVWQHAVFIVITGLHTKQTSKQANKQTNKGNTQLVLLVEVLESRKLVCCCFRHVAWSACSVTSPTLDKCCNLFVSISPNQIWSNLLGGGCCCLRNSLCSVLVIHDFVLTPVKQSTRHQSKLN